jgi:hypothetical protein
MRGAHKKSVVSGKRSNPRNENNGGREHMGRNRRWTGSDGEKVEG